jgi:hypothetical protein
MFTVAGGILLAVFIGLILIGLALVIRDAARFAYRNLGFCAVALGLTVFAILKYGSALYQ